MLLYEYGCRVPILWVVQDLFGMFEGNLEGGRDRTLWESVLVVSSANSDTRAHLETRWMRLEFTQRVTTPCTQNIPCTNKLGTSFACRSLDQGIKSYISRCGNIEAVHVAAARTTSLSPPTTGAGDIPRIPRAFHQQHEPVEDWVINARCIQPYSKQTSSIWIHFTVSQWIQVYSTYSLDCKAWFGRGRPGVGYVQDGKGYL